jgi:hypothetical protein
MKASTANFLNAIILIAAGLYGYFLIPAASGTQSPTALIPTAFGVIFLVLHKGVASANKVAGHIVAVLVLALLAMCIWRFTLVPEWNAKKYIFLICIISNAVTLIAFVGSFIAARKKRSVNNG